MTPATEMVRPEAVERKAANAPPASTADSTVPRGPGATSDGRSRVTESARLPSGSVGRYTRPSTP